ncbi:MAG: molybdenum cofactor guanylyltransferase [Candidatus Eiseniibacteriota bacterium]
MRNAGVLLAGGKGSRLGPGSPKALRPFAGSTLLLRAAALLAPRVEWLWVAVPPSFPLPLGQWDRVDDLAYEAGPLAGLVPGLERAAAAGAEVALVLAVDLPDIRSVHFDRLVAALSPVDGPDGTRMAVPPAAVLPRTPRGIEPLVGAYRPVYCAPVLRAAWNRGERAVHRAISEIGGRLTLLDATKEDVWPGGAATLESLNTTEDWVRAEARLRGPRL